MVVLAPKVQSLNLSPFYMNEILEIVFLMFEVHKGMIRFETSTHTQGYDNI